jgi:hypothetical protein
MKHDPSPVDFEPASHELSLLMAWWILLRGDIIDGDIKMIDML